MIDIALMFEPIYKFLMVTAGGMTLYGMSDVILSNAKSSNALCKAKELKEYISHGSNNLAISENVTIKRKYANEHVLMVGPQGCGKSTRFIMHNVKACQGITQIITDPSGEIRERVCLDKDTKVITLNLLSEDTCGYDILANCNNTFDVKNAVETLLINGALSMGTETSVDRLDWVQMSLPLVKAFAVMNFKTRRYKFDDMMLNILVRPMAKSEIRQGTPDISLETEIMSSGVVEAQTEMLSFLKVKDSPQTLGSIRNTLTASLQLFHEPNVQRVCRKDSINFEELRKTPTTVFIQVPERYSRHYSPLTSVFLQQLIDRCLDVQGVPIQFLFDEFCNIGKIPDLDLVLSTCRKHSISIVACIQNLTQLTKVYGEIQAKELQELFKTILVCGGLKDSCEYFSNMIGKTFKTEKDKEIEKQVITSDEIRRLDRDSVLVLCQNKRAVIDRLLPIYGKGINYGS